MYFISIIVSKMNVPKFNVFNWIFQCTVQPYERPNGGIDNIIIRFQNKETKAVIELLVPRKGAMSKSSGRGGTGLVDARIDQLVGQVARVLRTVLE